MLDVHSNGPAPAYAIESDSEDDRWDEELAHEPSHKPRQVLVETPALEWSPERPQVTFDAGATTLLVLVGDPGILVASGLPPETISTCQPFYRLDRLLVSPSARFVLANSNPVPNHLLTSLAAKLLDDLDPPSLTIFSQYLPHAFLPESNDDRSPPPLRYLASSHRPGLHGSDTLQKLGCHHFSVPNLVTGFEAALMIQATLRRIECKLILLPAISRPHDEAESVSIPTSYGTPALGPSPVLLPSLPSLQDPRLAQCVKSIVDTFVLSSLDSNRRWQLPHKLDPLFLQLFTAMASRPTLSHSSPLPPPNTKDISLMYL